MSDGGLSLPSNQIPNQLTFIVGSNAWKSVFGNVVEKLDLEVVQNFDKEACDSLFNPIWALYGHPSSELCPKVNVQQRSSGVMLFVSNCVTQLNS